MKRIKKYINRIVIFILALLVVIVVAFKIYTTNYYRADMGLIDNIEEVLSGKVHSFSDKNGTVFLPTKKDIKAVIVFYPGGKVEYNSYNGLMYELAARGYICLLPKMPENLAFLRTNAADILTASYSEYTATVKDIDWYLAGHSLGGVAASTYLKQITDNPNSSTEPSHLPGYKGIILCASYLNVDFSDADYRLLSIYGTNDKVLNMEQYEARKEYWPEDSEEHAIEGGIHSYFGSYGIQEGDGTPEISNYQQITQTADIIADWVSQ